VHVIKASNGEIVATLSEDDWVLALDFTPDSSALAVGSRDTVSIWDTESWERTHQFTGTGEVGTVKFVEGKKRLLVSASDGVFVWDMQERHRVWERTPDGLSEIVGQTSSATPDGTRLAAVLPAGDIHVLDVGTGSKICELRRRAARLLGLALSPRDPVGAGIYSDGVVAIWDLRTGEILVNFSVPERYHGKVRFAPDGAKLLTCGARWPKGSGVEMWSVSGDYSSVRNQ
jgi:WD40 repeat protein